MSAELESALDNFFEDWADSRPIFDALRREVESLGDVALRVTNSQVAFHRKAAFCRQKPFAWAWMPERYLRRKAAPLVLTLSFRERNPSERWKQIVEPYLGRFTHHLELYSSAEIDEQLRGWLQAAWKQAG